MLYASDEQKSSGLDHLKLQHVHGTKVMPQGNFYTNFTPFSIFFMPLQAHDTQKIVTLIPEFPEHIHIPATTCEKTHQPSISDIQKCQYNNLPA
jgi:hypothetical protein